MDEIAEEIAFKYGHKNGPTPDDYSLASKTERELRAIYASGEIEDIEENWPEYDGLRKELKLKSKIKQLRRIKEVRADIAAKREALRLIEEREKKNDRKAKMNRRLAEFAGFHEFAESVEMN